MSWISCLKGSLHQVAYTLCLNVYFQRAVRQTSYQGPTWHHHLSLVWNVIKRGKWAGIQFHLCCFFCAFDWRRKTLLIPTLIMGPADWTMETSIWSEFSPFILTVRWGEGAVPVSKLCWMEIAKINFSVYCGNFRKWPEISRDVLPSIE